MGETWYYAVDGERYGPVEEQELRDMATEGSLQPSDYVWSTQSRSDWVQARTVRGLFVLRRLEPNPSRRKQTSRATAPTVKPHTAPEEPVRELRKPDTQTTQTEDAADDPLPTLRAKPAEDPEQTQASPLAVTTDEFVRLAQDVVVGGSAIRFKASGRSMLPVIRDGDVITVVPVDERGLRVGDVVLHRSGETGLLAHRIIRTTRRGLGKTLYTRGDAHGGEPQLVEEEDVIGRVTEVERGGRSRRIDRASQHLQGRLRALRRSVLKKH